MDKIMAYIFAFPNGDMYCVGADWAIKDLLNNFIIQREIGNNITLQNWKKRIVNNTIYCRFEPKGIHGIYMFISNYFMLKKHCLWITREEYDEALFLYEPQKIGELLEITEEEAEYIKNNTFWKGKFSY